MKSQLLILILLLVIRFTAGAQLLDDFDDSSFPSDPDWVGDVANFQVNEALELQLMAPDGGVSEIYSAISLPNDTISFAFKFKLDFNPSGSNALRVYLAVDGTDPTTASGYFIELGETGSSDAIRFFQLDAGIPTMIATATLGAVAEEPDVNIRIDAYPSGLWVLQADYQGGTFIQEEASFMANDHNIFGDGFFGLGCTYTSSRADLFFFDDISVVPFMRDATPPAVASANVTNNTQIEVIFSEPVDDSTASLLSNYSISGIGNPIAVDILDPTRIWLTFDTDFPANESFTLEVKDIIDLFENIMPVPQSFTLSFARRPLAGDVIVNEIMFASILDNEDYVELRNVTADFIDISGYQLGNNTKTESPKIIEARTILPPNGYLAFTENKLIVLVGYEPISPDNILEQDIPSLNNDSGNIYFAEPDGTVLDSYDYDEDHHFELLVLIKGVSLERKSPTVDGNDPENWTSASRDVKFGTPGYENSALLPTIEVEEQFQFIEKVFSPDGDNNRDQMILGYNLDKSGYVANIEIRDVGGFLINTLKSNESLSTTGLITWNGLDMEGNISNIGMYIVIGEVFHPDGEVIPVKKVCVLEAKL